MDTFSDAQHDCLTCEHRDSCEVEGKETYELSSAIRHLIESFPRTKLSEPFLYLMESAVEQLILLQNALNGFQRLQRFMDTGESFKALIEFYKSANPLSRDEVLDVSDMLNWYLRQANEIYGHIDVGTEGDG